MVSAQAAVLGGGDAALSRRLWQIPLRVMLLPPLDESPAAESGGLSSASSKRLLFVG